ncbi:MAG: FadR family transcriptional regulator [Anaerolineaceae bacterium]|nr:FadR family transcriptional regulator [Anaerolineaceae bacterium]
MASKRVFSNLLSEFVRYLVSRNHQDDKRIPPLSELSKELNISVARLREQMEVARSLGFVEARPRVGISRLPYSLRPALQQSLAYAIEIEPDSYHEFANLRNHLEVSYWYEAVSKLTLEDKEELQDIVISAMEKLGRKPVEIPHIEHKKLHLLIYSRIDNPFTSSILETYWDLYEIEGLDRFRNLDYLQRLWSYHDLIVKSILDGEYEKGYQVLKEHLNLIYQRIKPLRKFGFE